MPRHRTAYAAADARAQASSCTDGGAGLPLRAAAGRGGTGAVLPPHDAAPPPPSPRPAATMGAMGALAPEAEPRASAPVRTTAPAAPQGFAPGLHPGAAPPPRSARASCFSMGREGSAQTRTDAPASRESWIASAAALSSSYPSSCGVEENGPTGRTRTASTGTSTGRNTEKAAESSGPPPGVGGTVRRPSDACAATSANRNMSTPAPTERKAAEAGAPHASAGTPDAEPGADVGEAAQCWSPPPRPPPPLATARLAWFATPPAPGNPPTRSHSRALCESGRFRPDWRRSLLPVEPGVPSPVPAACAASSGCSRWCSRLGWVSVVGRTHRQRRSRWSVRRGGGSAAPCGCSNGEARCAAAARCAGSPVASSGGKLGAAAAAPTCARTRRVRMQLSRGASSSEADETDGLSPVAGNAPPVPWAACASATPSCAAPWPRAGTTGESSASIPAKSSTPDSHPDLASAPAAQPASTTSTPAAVATPATVPAASGVLAHAQPSVPALFSAPATPSAAGGTMRASIACARASALSAQGSAPYAYTYAPAPATSTRAAPGAAAAALAATAARESSSCLTDRCAGVASPPSCAQDPALWPAGGRPGGPVPLAEGAADVVAADLAGRRGCASPRCVDHAPFKDSALSPPGPK
eukprot:scaffold11428_cov105-Isochrysis_galbana.AAC.13